MKFNEAYEPLTNTTGATTANKPVNVGQEARAYALKQGTTVVRSNDRRALAQNKDASVAADVVKQSFAQMYAALQHLQDRSVIGILRTAENTALKKL
jgi:tRNA splicing endonuclease